MGDISSPTIPTAPKPERQNDNAVPSANPSTQKPSPAIGLSRQPAPIRQSSQGSVNTVSFADQFNSKSNISSPTGEQIPFSMAPMASTLPHGGYQPPGPPGVHRAYSQPNSAAVMHHMAPNHFIGHPPGPMMMPGYYVQHPNVPQYYAANTMAGSPGQHPMQGQGNAGFYPPQFIIEHPQGPGYYQQPTPFHEQSRTRPDYMMNRQHSQGHIQHGGRNQPRRPSNRTSRSFRDQPSPSVDTSRQQAVVRGPPRRPHQSGHAVWIGNLPPQTDLMGLVGHVYGLAPSLQSVFLITKSNCAFANFKEEEACLEAQRAIQESKFQSVRLVCRLRKNTAESPDATDGPSENPIVIASGTSNPTSPTIPREDSETISPVPEKAGIIEASESSISRRDSTGNLPQRDRFFVLKSLTHQDLEQSVRTGVWATQSHNEEILNNAFKNTESVYLIFSANKSGEYFGFARMVSQINQDPDAAIQFAPQTQMADESDMPQTVTIEAKDNIPRGSIIDDSARGTMFWEIEGNEIKEDFGDEGEVAPKEADDADEEMQTRGKPFSLEWLSTIRLPFYRTRGLRNPWNSNREVKIARDGTELEPSVGRRLIGLMSNNSNLGTGRSMNDRRGTPTYFHPVMSPYN